MKPKYRIEFLDEAVEFLNNIDNKASEKIYYNLKKSQITNDNTLFKKLNDEIWEFKHCLNERNTDYLLFGIKQTKKIHL